MVSLVHAAGLSGIEGYIVSVECFFSGGLPRLDIVGLPGKAVSEAGERVRAAIKSVGYEWPVSRVTINLAPADVRKEGPVYDLPILLAVLTASGQIAPPPDDALFIGELSLTGALRPVSGVLSMVLAARDAGLRRAYVPEGNAAEAAYAEGIEVFPVPTLVTLLNHLYHGAVLSPCPPARAACGLGRFPRLLPRPGSADGQACAGDRRRRRTQHLIMRLARFGQEHDGQALFHHPAPARPR